MPLVAVSIRLDKIDEGLLYKAQDGSYWLSCVCVFDTDAKGRTLVVQSIPKERYAAGEKGRQIGYWRELGGSANPPMREGKGFALSKYKAPAAAQHKPQQQGAYPQGEESLPPAPREPQQEPQAGELPGELGF